MGSEAEQPPQHGAADRVRHPRKAAATIHGVLAPSDASPRFWHGLGEAWTALTYVIGGILVWGGLGLLGDHLLGTRPILTVVGALVGNAGGIYAVYIRYPIGKEPGRAP